MTRTLALLLLLTLTRSALAGEIIPNGGFEAGLSGWRPLWTREAGAGTLTLDTAETHAGRSAARVEHRGQGDWSLAQGLRCPVKPGDLYELQAWVKLNGPGSAVLSVVTYGARGEVLNWTYAEQTARQSDGWRLLKARFGLPAPVREIEPRVIGYGPATVWVDDVSLRRTGNVAELRGRTLPKTLTLTNASLSVAVSTADGALSVVDRRTKQRWRQQPVSTEVVVTGARRSGRSVRLTLLHIPTGGTLTAAFALDPRLPELAVTLSGGGALPSPLAYPHPFVSPAGAYLVVPMNEGISYPVEDASIPAMTLIAYGGHGICMPFWGVTDGRRGQMTLLETPDDASLRIDRVAGRLSGAPQWDPQRGRFGPARRLRYVFLDRGGHVAMCKRYRDYARRAGLLVTLAQKRARNPNVDRLIGAVNVWTWERDPLGLLRELRAAGIQRVLWSNAAPAEVLRAMNALGVLTSRYDIYQDVMDPARFPQLAWTHPDWTTDAWPKDLMRDARGDWVRGWEVETRDGARVPCGVLCDRQALPYARRRIAEELRQKPYLCRFIDTTTASPWRECYDPGHPMTRTESREWKMALLKLVSQEMGMVTGSETGHDAAVPYVHYFEGMLSLGPYRVPDAGRDMQRIWEEVPEPVARFQLGHRYRLPLWELVYHDCVVSQWYWGDYNNKLPALWDKRDLFNALYGTPPMFMFNRELWELNRDRFARSYRTVCPLVREVGYAEMTDHRFLTPNRDVQQTRFANGVTVTANFGQTPYRLSGGVEVPPMGCRVTRAGKASGAGARRAPRAPA